MTGRRRVALRSLVTVVALALLGACSGGGGPGIPDGFVEGGYADVVGFAYPADWKIVPPPEVPDPPRVVIEAPGRVGEFPTADLRLFAGPVKRNRDLDGVVRNQQADGELTLPGYRTVSERPYDVPGATGARLVESTYRAVSGGAAIRSFNLLAQDGKGNGVNMFVAGPGVDKALALRILATLRFVD